MNDREYDNKFMELYKGSVGSFYKEIFVNLFNDYSTIYETLKEGTKPSAIEANKRHDNSNDLDQLASLYETIKIKESNENYEESRINETNKFKCKFADALLKYIGNSKLYNDLSHESNVDYETSFHYVKIGDSIEMNPVIRYNVGYLFNSDENLSNRWNNEKMNYLNSILNTNFKAFVSDGFRKKGEVNTDVDIAIAGGMANSGRHRTDLVDNETGMVILAKYESNDNDKSKTVNIYNKSDLIGLDLANGTIKLMPFIDKVFCASTVLSENFRLGMLGTEANHPVREKSGFLGYDKNNNLMYDLNAYYEQETARQLAQDKRALICVAPAQYFAQNKIYGCHKYKRIAVMPEPKSKVYNYVGEIENTKTIDGGEFMFMAEHILENNTLQDAKVTDVNKPIGYSVNGKYGTTVEVKYASTAITNERIRSSVGNGQTDFYRLLKANCGVKFDQNVNLTTWMPLIPINRKKSFFKNAVSVPLFFTKAGVNYKIDDIVSKNDPNNKFLYERTLYEVDSEGKTIIRNGKESIIKEDVVLDSLFNIWEAMGGMWTMQKRNGELILHGDDSWYAVVDYMNKVGTVMVDAQGNSLLEQDGIPSQSNVYQPLKDPKYYVSSFNPPTTIKNGETNVNPEGAWTSDQPLRTMRVTTKGFGIQMNPDHLADDAEITEPSQVINSLCAGGSTIGKANRAYRALEGTMNAILSNEFDKLNKFLKSKDNNDLSIEQKEKFKNEFIELVSRDLLSTKLNKSAGMISSLVDKLCMKYNISDDRREQIKTSLNSVPFSDTEVYNSALPNFVSKINKTIIKKKFSGSAMVMCPSDNIHMMYRIGGNNYTKTELYNIACEYFNNNPNIEKPTNNSYLIESYLNHLQDIENNTIDSWENNLDNVRLGTKIIVPVTVNGIDLKHVKVDLDNDIKDYMNVKDNIGDGRKDVIKKFAIKQGLISENDEITIGTRFYNDIKSPTNLQPQRIYWTETVDGQTKRYDVYDIKAIRNAFIFRENNNMDMTDFDATHNINPELFNPSELKRRRLKAYQNDIESAMNLLQQGISPITGNKIEGGVKNVPAENIMAKIYSTSFGIGNHSINEIMKDDKFFKNQIKNYAVDLNDHFLWDLKLIVNQNKNIKIAFASTISEQTSNSSSGTKSFDANVSTTIKVVDGKEEIWETNKDGYPIIKLGYVEYDETGAAKTKWIMKPVIVNHADGVKERIYSIFDEMAGESIKCITDIVNNNSITLFKKSENPKINYILNNINSNDSDLNDYFKSGDNNKRINNLSARKLVSFKKSLDTICLRIPSQSMQSFMNMKVVAFMEGDSNNIYVSKWQTYLQGSDYDIDKAYCIGNEFTENGLYIKSSPLYDESTYEMSLISDTLPVPNGKKYGLSEDGLDVSLYCERYNNGDVAEKLRALSDALNYIDENAEVNSLKINSSNSNVFLSKINQHESYKVAPSLIESAYKNVVSSAIYDVISDLRNATQAYSPITFLNLHDIADRSELGERSKRSTAMNPATKYQVQSEAQVGKECIGIFAVAAKAYFALTYYYDMVMKRGDMNEIKKLLFKKHYNITDSVSDNIKMILSNVNVSYLSPDTRLKLEDKLRTIFSDIYRAMVTNDENEINRINTKGLFGIEGMQHDTSLQISAMLSAATDNAKEFILAKINSAANLSGVYAHLLMLGYDLDTIASFMTLPHVQLINDYSSQNVFDKTAGDNSVKSAMRNLTTLNVSKYFFPVKKKARFDEDNFDFESFGQEMEDSDDFQQTIDNTDLSVAFTYVTKGGLINKINDAAKELNLIGEGESFIIPTKKKRGKLIVQSKDVYLALLQISAVSENAGLSILNGMLTDKTLVNNLSEYIGKKSLIDFVSDIKMSILDTLSVINSNRYENAEDRIKKVDLFMNDINEFSRIYDDAQEVKTLGQILGINQGIKTKSSEQIQLVYKLQDYFNERIHKFISEYDYEKDTITYNAPDTYQDKINHLIDNNNNSSVYSKEELLNILNQAANKGMLDDFDMRKFVIDKDYRNIACKLYDLVKCQYNIFDIIDKHPNVRGMYDAFRFVLSIQDNVIAKDYMINKLVGEMKGMSNDKVYLNEKEAAKAVGFSDDVIKYNFIINQDFSFMPSKRFSKCEEIENIDEDGNRMSVAVRDSDSIATLNKFFYEEFIPDLKRGYVGDKYDEGLTQNAFIRSLVSGYDTNGGSVKMFKKLDIDMNDISNPRLFAKRSKIKRDMFKLKSIEYNGRPLLDWLVLYNFVVNKNKYGEERMTMIFQPLINDDGDNLLKRYYEYVIAVDEKVSDMSQYEKDNDTTEDNGTTANKGSFSRIYKNGKATLGLKYGSEDFNMAIAIPTKEVSAKRQYIYAWSKDSEEMVLKKRMNNGMYEMTYENMGLRSKPNQSQINNFKS